MNKQVLILIILLILVGISLVFVKISFSPNHDYNFKTKINTPKICQPKNPDSFQPEGVIKKESSCGC